MAKHISINRRYQLPPEVEVISDVEDPAHNRIDIHISFPSPERMCPRCGSHNCVVKDSGRMQTVRHLPAMNRSVFITFKRRRFLCKDCGSSYYEPVDLIHDRLHMTKELLVDICLKFTEMKTMRQIAADEMVTEDVVSDVLSIISIDRPEHLPHILCVDEFKGNSGSYTPGRQKRDTRKFLTNITDGDQHVLIDVLPFIKGSEVGDYFMDYSLQERNRVKYFSCDMSNSYISVAKRCFPNALICIDLFHIVKRLNDAMDDIRIRVQNSLLKASREASLLAENEDNPDKKEQYVQEQIKQFSNYSRLKNAHIILVTKESSKEALWGTKMTVQTERLRIALSFSPDLQEMYDRLQEFHVILETKEFTLQRAGFTDWLDQCLSSEVPEIRAAASTLKHWRGYIHNTWKYRQVSNGIAEGINNKIKTFKRICYGCPDFESFRKRLLLVCGPIHTAHSPAVTFRNKINDGKGEIRL